MITERDAIDIMVIHQINALVRCGRPVESARHEAEDIVSMILEDMARIGLRDVYIGVALRRARVYKLRDQGVTSIVVSERMGICLAQAKNDYKSEMIRRRRNVA